MSAVAGRLASMAGLGGAALVVTVQPGLLVPVALVVAVLGGVLLLLIVSMALVAVCPREFSTPVAKEGRSRSSFVDG